MSAPRILTRGLIFDQAEHVYHLDGERLPGVTSILKAAGFVEDRWFDDWSRDRGSAVHLACHFDDEGDLDESKLDPRIEPYLVAWRSFRKDTGLAPLRFDSFQIASEICVASRIYRFATTVDRVMTPGGQDQPGPRTLVEIKTGAPGDGAALQTAGQTLALSENGIFVSHRYAVRLRPDGHYDPTKHADHARDRDDFLAGLRVARRTGKLWPS